jgi:hypothetical protein
MIFECYRPYSFGETIEFDKPQIFYGWCDSQQVFLSASIRNMDDTLVQDGAIFSQSPYWGVAFPHLTDPNFTNDKFYRLRLTFQVYSINLIHEIIFQGVEPTVASATLQYPEANQNLRAKHVVAFGKVDPAGTPVTEATLTHANNSLYNADSKNTLANCWYAQWKDLKAGFYNLKVKIADYPNDLVAANLDIR